VRLMRPLMALRLRRVRRRAALEPLRQEEKGGPFGPVIEGLDGLPLARIYRAAIQGMWESQALSRRAKALVLAVVGRALECPFSEQEGRRLALSEGLRACDFDDVLAHLASPTLDAVESVAVPFARETVWYQPARIQKRAREVMGALSREQFTELIAVVSLANALCRIGPVLAWLR
jgi:alkylhydroperoxidase family enzyme